MWKRKKKKHVGWKCQMKWNCFRRRFLQRRTFISESLRNFGGPEWLQDHRAERQIKDRQMDPGGHRQTDAGSKQSTVCLWRVELPLKHRDTAAEWRASEACVAPLRFPAREGTAFHKCIKVAFQRQKRTEAEQYGNSRGFKVDCQVVKTESKQTKKTPTNSQDVL